jgi:hypothetical protein
MLPLNVSPIGPDIVPTDPTLMGVFVPALGAGPGALCGAGEAPADPVAGAPPLVAAAIRASGGLPSWLLGERG